MNISNEYMQPIVGVASMLLSNVIIWFLAKKRYNSEVDATLISNMQDSLEFYMKLSDDNKTRLEETLRRNESLEKEIHQLRDQVFKLMDNWVREPKNLKSKDTNTISNSNKNKEFKEIKINEIDSNKKIQRTKLHNR